MSLSPQPEHFPKKEKIELLSVKLLDQNRSQIEALKQLARLLRLEFGWHYLLDISWLLTSLGPAHGLRVMDAGAGTGIIQWFLAKSGAEVISVDRTSRSALPLRFRRRFYVRGLRAMDLDPALQVFKNEFKLRKSWSSRGRYVGRFLLDLANPEHSPGQVTVYNQDLKTLVDIPDGAVDAVVAVSALEHNPPDELPIVVAELMRILKPGGVLLATLNAARDHDWFHTPSKGWCYTADSLRRLFNLPAGLASNYEKYDELFMALQNCSELRDSLAEFYFRSGENGMPWGKWDPQYLPVGVCKVKEKQYGS